MPSTVSIFDFHEMVFCNFDEVNSGFYHATWTSLKSKESYIKLAVENHTKINLPQVYYIEERLVTLRVIFFSFSIIKIYSSIARTS